MSKIHFLTLNTTGKDSIKYVTKLFFDDENNQIVQVVDQEEINSTLEEFDIRYKDIHYFMVNVDKYMTHPGITWKDEEFVDNMIERYIFDEDIYD